MICWWPMISGKKKTSGTASRSRRQHLDGHSHLPTTGAKVSMESSLQSKLLVIRMIWCTCALYFLTCCFTWTRRHKQTNKQVLQGTLVNMFQAFRYKRNFPYLWFWHNCRAGKISCQIPSSCCGEDVFNFAFLPPASSPSRRRGRSTRSGCTCCGRPAGIAQRRRGRRGAGPPTGRGRGGDTCTHIFLKNNAVWNLYFWNHLSLPRHGRPKDPNQVSCEVERPPKRRHDDVSLETFELKCDILPSIAAHVQCMPTVGPSNESIFFNVPPQLPPN